jgi:CBS domain-containing protein
LHEKSPQDWIVGDVLDLKKRRLFCMNKTANLSQVIHIMERHDISRIPVVEIDSKNRPLLIGWLTKHDINRMYVSEKALAVLEEQESFFLSFDC